MMELQEFLALPGWRIAELVRAKGNVCGFPVNGTRRWFEIEAYRRGWENRPAAYLREAFRQYREVFELFFAHGLTTLLCPIMGPDLMERGAAYREMAAEGLRELAVGSLFQDFYRQHGVRVGFYGDYADWFAGNGMAGLAEAFEQARAMTMNNGERRVFFGVFADDPAEQLAKISVAFYQSTGRAPCRGEIVERYYGEMVEPVGLFIGSGAPAVFDIPLLLSGSESLYFTVIPSLYLDEGMLRRILYDYLFCRNLLEDYSRLEQNELNSMAEVTRAQRDRILGVGKRSQDGSFWLPE
jgi:hypothetical protein